jgi:hypothetical protein
VYVDDLLLCTTTQALADRLVAQFVAKFNVSDLGEIAWCLGMHVTTSPDRRTVSLDLERYILDILARYGFESLQSVPTPMLHTTKLTDGDAPATDKQRADMEAYPFRSAISALMFAMVVMRCDISFPVICCARFSANPGLPHWYAVVRIYLYTSRGRLHRSSPTVE